MRAECVCEDVHVGGRGKYGKVDYLETRKFCCFRTEFKRTILEYDISLFSLTVLVHFARFHAVIHAFVYI